MYSICNCAYGVHAVLIKGHFALGNVSFVEANIPCMIGCLQISDAPDKMCTSVHKYITRNSMAPIPTILLAVTTSSWRNFVPFLAQKFLLRT